MKASSSELAKQNKTALLFVCIATALLCLLFSMPLLFFDVTVYSQKSSNTFVGDE